MVNNDNYVNNVKHDNYENNDTSHQTATSNNNAKNLCIDRNGKRDKSINAFKST